MRENWVLCDECLREFGEHLHREERAPGTIEKYLRDVRAFASWAGGRAVSKELVSDWKEQLRREGKATVTVNSMLAAVHACFDFLDWQGCKVKYLKVQRRMFRDSSRELSREDFSRLVDTAGQRGQKRLSLLLETICATGIRVSEVRYITVEAAETGRAEIALKGKIRTILLPGKLARKLVKYARKQKIASGEIFLTRSGKGLSRRQIWAEMKALCKHAGVDATKVFPHNLRHLFARAYYKVCRDIARLADVLGHSSIETTRIYLITTGDECARQIEGLGLVQ